MVDSPFRLASAANKPLRLMLWLDSATGRVLGHEIVERTDAIKGAAERVVAAARSARARPRALKLADERLASTIVQLGAGQFDVQTRPCPRIDELAHAIAASVASHTPSYVATAELDVPLVSQFFQAAARYRTVAAWEELEDRTVLLDVPDLGRTGMCVGMATHLGFMLSDSESEMGLATARLRAGSPLLPAMAGLRFVCLRLLAANLVPMSMQREAASYGWTLPAPQTYPCIDGVDAAGLRIFPSWEDYRLVTVSTIAVNRVVTEFRRTGQAGRLTWTVDGIRGKPTISGALAPFIN